MDNQKVENKYISIEITGLETIPKEAVKIVDKALSLTAIELQRHMVLEAPIDEGYLRESIQLPKKTGYLEQSISIEAAYWRPVQFGILKEYDIFPSKAKALAFEIDGEMIFCKHVHMPTREGNPFITRAIDKTIPRINEFIQTVIDAGRI